MAITPVSFTLVYSTVDPQVWSEVLAPADHLPATYTLSSGLTPGLIHYFAVKAANMFGVTQSEILTVKGCTSPLTGPLTFEVN